jgi:hypothetical protein
MEPSPLSCLRTEPASRLGLSVSIGAKVKHARISAADIVRAREAAESAGLRLAGIEKRPDGTVKLEFADLGTEDGSHWFAGSPLYKDARA